MVHYKLGELEHSQDLYARAYDIQVYNTSSWACTYGNLVPAIERSNLPGGKVRRSRCYAISLCLEGIVK